MNWMEMEACLQRRVAQEFEVEAGDRNLALGASAFAAAMTAHKRVWWRQKPMGVDDFPFAANQTQVELELELVIQQTLSLTVQ